MHSSRPASVVAAQHHLKKRGVGGERKVLWRQPNRESGDVLAQSKLDCLSGTLGWPALAAFSAVCGLDNCVLRTARTARGGGLSDQDHKLNLHPRRPLPLPSSPTLFCITAFRPFPAAPGRQGATCANRFFGVFPRSVPSPSFSCPPSEMAPAALRRAWRKGRPRHRQLLRGGGKPPDLPYPIPPPKPARRS